MRKLLLFLIFLIIISCTNNKNVYWCGDHPCINNKEKEAYFKRTMIVEIKEIKKKDSKSVHETKKIMQQAKLEEKRRIKEEKDLVKQAKLEEKRRINEEKDLAKQAKLEEKRRIKEEKDLVKKLEQEEKILNNKKKVYKKEIVNNQKEKFEKSVELDVNIVNFKIEFNKFRELVEKITKRNTFRPYPDINDIPN